MLCLYWLSQAVIRLSLYLRRVNVLFEGSCYSDGVENSCVLWRSECSRCNGIRKCQGCIALNFAIVRALDVEGLNWEVCADPLSNDSNGVLG